MTDQIIIEFQADTSQLKPAIDMLTQLGQVDKTFAAQLQSGNKDLEKRARGFQSNADAAKKMQTSLGDLSTNAEKLADAFQKGAEAGFAKAMQETSIKIKELEDAIKKLSKTTDDTKKPQQSLRGELREMTAQLTRLKLAGQDNTEEYLRLKNAAGELKDAIGDASEEIGQAGSDTRGLDQALRVTTVVTAGFTALQGAAALFGEENEDVQRAILKVNGALSILNSLQAVQAELARKDSVFTTAAAGAKTLYARAVQFATAQTVAFRVALAALGIGAVITLIAGLVSNWDKLKNAITGSTNSLDDFIKKEEERQKQADRSKAILDAQTQLELKRADLLEKQGNKTEARQIREAALSKSLAGAKAEENRLAASRAQIEAKIQEELKKSEAAIARGAKQTVFYGNSVQIVEKSQAQLNKELEAAEKTIRSKYAVAISDLTLKQTQAAEATTATEIAILNLDDETAKSTKKVTDEIKAQTGSIADLNAQIAKLKELQDKSNNPAKVAEYQQKIDDLTKRIELLNFEIQRLINLNNRVSENPTALDPIITKVEQFKTEAELAAEAYAKLPIAIREANQELINNPPPSPYANVKTPEQIKAEEKERQDIIKNLSINTAAEVLGIIAMQRAQARQRELEADLIALDARKSAELGVEGLTAEQRLQIERRFAREAALIRRKQFIAEQNAKISETLINSFAAVGRLLVQTPPPNPAFFQGLALIGIQSALAVAQIKAQKPPEIPQFKKGTRYGPGKVSLVGEEGPELKMVERGAKVYTAKQTEKIINVLSHFPGMADEIVRGNMPAISRPEEMVMQGGVSIDYDRFGKSVAENLRVEQTVVNNNMDANGFMLYVTKSGSSQTIRNQRRRIS